jgi:hypothetical protein
MGSFAVNDRFTVILAFFCNTQRYCGVMQNGDILIDASIPVGLPGIWKQN